MCLINVAHEHLTTQTGKKSKPALINVIGPGAEGRLGAGGRGPTWGRGPRAEKNKYPLILSFNFEKLKGIKETPLLYKEVP